MERAILGVSLRDWIRNVEISPKESEVEVAVGRAGHIVRKQIGAQNFLNGDRLSEDVAWVDRSPRLTY